MNFFPFFMLILTQVIIIPAAETGLAAYGIVANMNIIAIAIFRGVGQGLQPLLSTYYGDKKLQKMRKVSQLALITSLVMSGIMMLLGWPILDTAVAIFNGEKSSS